jgi:hypothetical protein
MRPDVDPVGDSIDALRRAGWSVGDAASTGPDGPVWLITGHNGENLIRAEGPTRADAGALLSDDGLYRFRLWRTWCLRPGTARVVNFVMLNPSAADAARDDPTVRRCAGFARRWGFDGLTVTNLYALRAADPRRPWAAPDPVGPANDEHLAEARAAALVVCAWGRHGEKGGRGGSVLTLLAGLGVAPHALALTASGEPAHPLYLPAGSGPLALAISGKPDL